MSTDEGIGDLFPRVVWHTEAPMICTAPEIRAKSANLEDFTTRINNQLPAIFDQWTPLAKAQYLESTLILSNDLLSSQGDRMAMANAIEGRFPFLDHRVVELAASMPDKLRLNSLTEKLILKQIARKQVPPELIDRAKQPYRAPISRCFIGAEAPDHVTEMLSPEAQKRSGYFDSVKVQRLIAKSRQQEGQLVSEQENMALVAIRSTQLLDHQFIRNFPNFSNAPMDHAVLEGQ